MHVNTNVPDTIKSHSMSVHIHVQIMRSRKTMQILIEVLFAQEIEHTIKEKPNISIPTLRYEIIDKLGYTASYKKVWLAKRKVVEHIFGKSEESDSPDLDVKCRGKDRPRSTNLGNGMDVNGEKLANLCGICRQRLQL